jgi:transposase
MQETQDIAAYEAAIATLESQLESLSRDNDALAAENRRLAGDLARADAEWAARLAELEARKDRAYAQLKSEHDKLVELVKMANAREFGAKSERVLPHQVSLFNDVEAAAPAPAPGPAPRARKKRKPKRKVDWASFETTVVEHESPEDGRDCPACGHGMEPMGYEVRREFVYVPARVEVREHRVAKYVCRECSEANMADGGETPASIVGAPGPALPLPGTWASAELLAHVMKQKYQLAMPVYRIVGDLSSQQGLPVSRQTMAGWVIDAYGRWLSV